MTELFIDIETYSSRNLKKVGAYVYTESPDFDIMMAAWAIDDDPVQIALAHEDIYSIPGLWDPRVTKVAHNAAFERICFSAMGRGMLECDPGKYLDPRQFLDTQALAGEWGYPQKLEHLAKVLGVSEKDSAGTLLINFFCKPDRNGKRRRPEDHPEKWEKFIRYCMQDTETLREVRRALGEWPTPMEREFWIADQLINDVGLPIDTDLAHSAVEASKDNAFAQDVEFVMLTGVSNPNSGPQVTKWLRSNGVNLPNLQSDTIDDALLDPEIKPEIRRGLELKQELALVAAKKFNAATERTSADGRLRGAFHFFGAHTGRWAGRGVQFQNLPRQSLAAKTDTDAEVDAKIQAAVDKMKAGESVDAFTLKALVRSMFIGPFTVVDYAAIEARVVSWLAGEAWALQAFRDGRDIYVETAERMGGLSRQEGKVAVLALGYNGGVKALRRMGAEGTDAKLEFLRDQWREANPKIVEFWRQMEDSFRNGGPVGDFITVEKDASDRLVRLPSGRAVVYHNLKGKMEVDDWGRPRMRLNYASPMAPGLRTWTYGGKLTENITQAVARDVLAEAILRLHAEGHEIVGHVHDEVIIYGTPSLEGVIETMVVPPKWSTGLPIHAEGFQAPRYRKG